MSSTDQLNSNRFSFSVLLVVLLGTAIFWLLPIMNVAGRESLDDIQPAATMLVKGAGPVLSISKRATGSGGTLNLPLDSVVTYTIELSNSGDAPALGVVMTDTLPGGVTFGGFVQQGSAVLPPPGGTVTLPGGGTVTLPPNSLAWGPYDIPVNTGYTIVFTVTIGGGTALLGQTITNTAWFTSTNAGSGFDSAALSVEKAQYQVFLPVISKAPAIPSTNYLINPSANTYSAPRNTKVSITYEATVDPATVSPQTFAVHAMQSGLIMQTYSVNGTQVSLTPDRFFKPGEPVQVSATTGILKQGGGSATNTPVVWQFQTAVAASQGIFQNSNQQLGNLESFAVAMGDVDGDGDLDAFVVNCCGDPNKVWLNKGDGTFSDSGQNLGNLKSEAIALGDVDGDGDLDAFVGNVLGDPNKVWLNNGAGVFSNSGQNLGNASSGAVALGDVDGDGDLDAVVGNAFGTDDANKVWLNNGAGVFSDSGQKLGNAKTVALALGDVDGDNDLDIFACNISGQPGKVWLNNGNGSFVDGFSLNLECLEVVLGDVDGDGDLDALVSGSTDNNILLNDGRGIFTDSGQKLGSRSGILTMGDVDGDGDLDAFIAYYSTDHTIWLNDGSGVFSDSSQRLPSSSGHGVALGDVDSDGDLDAFIANDGEPNHVWLNQN